MSALLLGGTLQKLAPRGLTNAEINALLGPAANALKAGACAAMALGAPVGPCFALTGAGAALYSPAKYGLVTELMPPHRLVAANGWIDGRAAALASPIIQNSIDITRVSGASASISDTAAPQPAATRPLMVCTLWDSKAMRGRLPVSSNASMSSWR